jgi:geranylgeranyl pyrophosphate synthase
MNKAIEFVDQGKAALSVLPDSEAKMTLTRLADYMIERKY